MAENQGRRLSRTKLAGHGRLAEAASKVIAVIAFARHSGVRNLLIDTTRWTGHESPDAVERAQFAQAFAVAAHSALKLAMVVRPEMMDPDKVEVSAARNRGLLGNVFHSEKEAVAWLLEPTL